MKRLTTDNPQGDFEKLMNFAYTKHNRVHLSYADGKEDIDLCEYVSKLVKAKGFDFSPEFIMEDGLFDNYDDDFAVLYYLAAQAAELRNRLKLYEDKLENGTLIELPCKVGDSLYLVDLEYGVCKCIVNNIQILSDNEPVFTLYYYSQNGYEPAELEWDVDIESDCFGKTVFLTKEEAEAKLKELNKKCL